LAVRLSPSPIVQTEIRRLMQMQDALISQQGIHIPIDASPIMGVRNAVASLDAFDDFVELCPKLREFEQVLAWSGSAIVAAGKMQPVASIPVEQLMPLLSCRLS
jgi:hypothetical protein